MLTSYALNQDVRSALREIRDKTKDIPDDRKASRKVAIERLAGYGDVTDFGIDVDIPNKRTYTRVELQHNGYHINLTTGKRYNVVSEVGRPGPRRRCHCSVSFRMADGIFVGESKSTANCEEHDYVLGLSDEGRINDVLAKFGDGRASLYVSSGRYGWKSGMCEGDVEDWQIGISPRRPTKLLELKLGKLLAAQRRLIGQLRAAER